MNGYRLYFFSNNGRIMRSIEMECEGDDEAFQWQSSTGMVSTLNSESGPGS
jgi:hypothetical protein